MSSIASFYLLSDDERKTIESEKSPSLLELVCSKAQEVGTLPYSGYALLDVFTLLPEILPAGDDFGSVLSESAGTSCITSRTEDACLATETLNTADLSEETIRDYLAEEGREDDYPDFVEPIQNAAAWWKKCLEAIPEGHTGILVFG